MSLQERVYSVLVVSAAEKLNTALLPLLPEARFSPVRVVPGIAAARRLWAERSFDLVIVNAPLPDDVGTGFAIDIADSPGAAVLLLVRSELYEEFHDKATEHGVFTLAKPLNRSLLALALDWMISARERLKRLEKKTLSVEEKMEEIRLVNRAKWLLITELGMEEPQAHRYLEKQAMDRCVPRWVLAEEIIRTYT